MPFERGLYTRLRACSQRTGAFHWLLWSLIVSKEASLWFKFVLFCPMLNSVLDQSQFYSLTPCHSGSLIFLIITFASSISALNHNCSDFTNIPAGALSLMDAVSVMGAGHNDGTCGNSQIGRWGNLVGHVPFWALPWDPRRGSSSSYCELVHHCCHCFWASHAAGQTLSRSQTNEQLTKSLRGFAHRRWPWGHWPR